MVIIYIVVSRNRKPNLRDNIVTIGTSSSSPSEGFRASVISNFCTLTLTLISDLHLPKISLRPYRNAIHRKIDARKVLQLCHNQLDSISKRRKEIKRENNNGLYLSHKESKERKNIRRNKHNGLLYLRESIAK